MDNSDEQGGESLSANYSIEDFAPDSLQIMLADCAKFQSVNADLILRAWDESGQDAAQCGHDFWLTRNWHGAGFWDGDYTKETGKALTEAAKAFGYQDIYVGNDNRLHL
jgi:hypothetical protein